MIIGRLSLSDSTEVATGVDTLDKQIYVELTTGFGRSIAVFLSPTEARMVVSDIMSCVVELEEVTTYAEPD